jgi:hypothetical protein
LMFHLKQFFSDVGGRVTLGAGHYMSAGREAAVGAAERDEDTSITAVV